MEQATADRLHLASIPDYYLTYWTSLSQLGCWSAGLVPVDCDVLQGAADRTTSFGQGRGRAWRASRISTSSSWSMVRVSGSSSGVPALAARRSWSFFIGTTSTK